MTAGHLVGGLLSSFVVAAVIGLVAGIGWAFLLKQVRQLKHSIILTPSMVFIVFGLTEYLEFSGPVAVLAFGLVLGNLEGIARRFNWAGEGDAPARVEKMELEFIGELVFLLKTLFFVFLGISMRPADLWSPTAFAIVGLLLVVRFAMVRFSLRDMINGGADGSIIASLIPKGLAAAVMAAAASSEPNFPSGDQIDNVVYAVIFSASRRPHCLCFSLRKRDCPASSPDGVFPKNQATKMEPMRKEPLRQVGSQFPAKIGIVLRSETAIFADKRTATGAFAS